MKYPETNNRYILAPIAGVSDAAFRLMCARQGAGLCFTEMISANGIKYENLRTFDMLDALPEEGKLGIQLFGYDPDTIASTAAVLEQRIGDRIKLIDVNMGCPARKIVGNNEGSALMLDPPRAAMIIKKMKSAVSLPVTAKFRKGFDDEHLNAVEFALGLQDAGADAVTVHGRTRAQFFEGDCDLDTIAEVKRALSIPVAGNGGIFTPDDAGKMFKHTNCDAVMIARGSLGNPFLFSQLIEFEETGKWEEPSIKDKITTVIEQAEIACRQKGERIAIKQMRKHAAWYIKGMRGASALRAKIVMVNTLEELTDLLNEAMLYN